MTRKASGRPGTLAGAPQTAATRTHDEHSKREELVRELVELVRARCAADRSLARAALGPCCEVCAGARHLAPDLVELLAAAEVMPRGSELLRAPRGASGRWGAQG